MIAVVLAGLLVWIQVHRDENAPVGLHTTSVTGTSVSLAWTAPQGLPAGVAYQVRRNGEIVARLNGATSYVDSSLDAMTSYRYGVVTVIDGRDGGSSPDLVVSTSPLSPHSLVATRVTTTTVELAWAPPRGEAPDHYVVHRDGADLVTVPGTPTTFRDDGGAASTRHSYAVVAVTRGRRSAPSNAFAVLTSGARVDGARLAGSFNVEAVVVRTNGERNRVGDRKSESWGFGPACDQPGCTTSVESMGETVSTLPFSGTLTRAGNVYSGTETVFLMCGDSNHLYGITSTLTASVTGAAGFEGVWTATAFTGTLRTTAQAVDAADGRSCPALDTTIRLNGERAG